MRTKFVFLAFIMSLVSCNNEELFDGSTVNNSVEMSSAKSVDAKAMHSGQAYYWYHGEKIFLNVDTINKYVLEESDKVSSIRSFGNMDNVRLSDNTKWKALKDKNIVYSLKSRQRIADKNVVYSSPTYKSASTNEDVIISHLLYVKLKSKEDIGLLEEMARKYGLDILRNIDFLPLWYTLSCTENTKYSSLEMTNILYESGLFEAVDPDIITEKMLASVYSAPYANDTYYAKQWNLKAINWAGANEITNGVGVNLTVYDSGVEPLHPDFRKCPLGHDVVLGYFVNSIYHPHGTNCAGIIYAMANNNAGIVGIAEGVNLTAMAYDFEGNSPNKIEEIARGLAYAANYTDVVSCSWGSNNLTSTLIEDVFKYQMVWGREGKGTVIVFASGNSSSSVIFPANCNEGLLVVGAVGENLKRSSFSCYGKELDVVAPGENIPTTDLLWGNGYSSEDYNMNFGGTSAACPHVSAIAALILSVNPDLTNKQVADIIESTAQKVGSYNYQQYADRSNGTWNNEMGYGLVDAEAAVKKALEMK